MVPLVYASNRLKKIKSDTDEAEKEIDKPIIRVGDLKKHLSVMIEKVDKNKKEYKLKVHLTNLT